MSEQGKATESTKMVDAVPSVGGRPLEQSGSERSQKQQRVAGISTWDTARAKEWWEVNQKYPPWIVGEVVVVNGRYLLNARYEVLVGMGLKPTDANDARTKLDELGAIEKVDSKSEPTGPKENSRQSQDFVKVEELELWKSFEQEVKDMSTEDFDDVPADMIDNAATFCQSETDLEAFFLRRFVRPVSRMFGTAYIPVTQTIVNGLRIDICVTERPVRVVLPCGIKYVNSYHKCISESEEDTFYVPPEEYEYKNLSVESLEKFVPQIATYMKSVGDLTYGIMSNGLVCYAVKKVGYRKYEISNPVHHDGSGGVSIGEAIAFCLQKNLSLHASGEAESYFLLPEGMEGIEYFHGEIGATKAYSSGKEVFVKCALVGTEKAKLLQNESLMYKKVSHLQGKCIPRVFFDGYKNGEYGQKYFVLELEPVGVSLDEVANGDMKQLELKCVQVLAEISRGGVSVGDVRLSNFTVKDDKVFCIDFARAKSADSFQEEKKELCSAFAEYH